MCAKIVSALAQPAMEYVLHMLGELWNSFRVCSAYFKWWVWNELWLGCPGNQKNFGSNRNKPKQDLFRFCFGLFHETKNKKFRFVSVFRTYIETIETNRKCMLSIKLFRLVFCLFRFNRNIETLCFGIEANNRNQLFWNKPKQTEKTGKTVNFLKKCQNMLHIKLFRLVFCLFRFNRNIENL